MNSPVNPLFRASTKAAAFAALLLLAGCFASREPLITADTADTPIADGSRVVDFTNCAGAFGALTGCTGYQRDTTATFDLRNGEYIVHPDPSSNPLNNLPGMQGAGQDLRFYIKGIGGDLYVVQAPSAMTPPGPA